MNVLYLLTEVQPRTFSLETVCVCVCVSRLRCSLLTLAHSIKGLNEGFDSSSRFCIGVSAGIHRHGGDHGDAAPVTTVVRVRHSHLVSWRPVGHNGQGHRLYTVLGSIASLHNCEPTLFLHQMLRWWKRAKFIWICPKKLSISVEYFCITYFECEN